MLPIDDPGDGSWDGQPTSARAPSKLNCPATVPITAPTLTAVRTAEPLYAGGAHATVVADVHAVLPHVSAAASDAVDPATVVGYVTRRISSAGCAADTWSAHAASCSRNSVRPPALTAAYVAESRPTP
jgi:hypothetical protein